MDFGPAAGRIRLSGTTDGLVERRRSDRRVLIRSDNGVYRFEDETFRDWVLGEQPARHP